MKFLFDFFPVVAFFIAFYIPEDREQGIYLATMVAIAASFIQVTIYWFIHHRFERMHLITLALLVILGGATLLLHDERFIKLKPTAVNWIFALVFLGSQYIGGKNLVQRMMEQSVTVPKTVWTTLNMSWVAFFITMGAANLYVASNYSSEVWVNFKLFGILGLTFVFVFAQAIYMSRYVNEIKNSGE
ncbi:MAG: septation protein A [Gammaproteobacteria bacterium RBG_16_51_14]|nr:MAG: septation protein A [Gammaproteobacteria bacterium RBG_16_51_14]